MLSVSSAPSSSDGTTRTASEQRFKEIGGLSASVGRDVYVTADDGIRIEVENNYSIEKKWHFFLLSIISCLNQRCSVTRSLNFRYMLQIFDTFPQQSHIKSSASSKLPTATEHLTLLNNSKLAPSYKAKRSKHECSMTIRCKRLTYVTYCTMHVDVVLLFQLMGLTLFIFVIQPKNFTSLWCLPLLSSTVHLIIVKSPV